MDEAMHVSSMAYRGDEETSRNYYIDMSAANLFPLPQLSIFISQLESDFPIYSVLRIWKCRGCIAGYLLGSAARIARR